MKQPPVLQTMSNDDEEAEIQAVMARRHASEMVRDHLETHAANNPGTSSDYGKSSLTIVRATNLFHIRSEF